MEVKINWIKKEGTCETFYGSDCEFNISKDENFWVLRYTDYWTLYPISFFVNIKNQGSEMFSVLELQQFAEKVNEEKLRIMKLKDDIKIEL